MLALWAKLFGVADAVTFSVDFADGDKRHLLAAADLFVSPCDNLQETFGISVVEAMAAGLPAIVSDFDGYKDTVTPEVGVRVTTRWNPDQSFLSEIGPLLYERPLHLLLGQSVEVDLGELEEAIVALAADDRRRAEMSRRARGARARHLRLAGGHRRLRGGLAAAGGAAPPRGGPRGGRHRARAPSAGDELRRDLLALSDRADRGRAHGRPLRGRARSATPTTAT